MSTSDRLLAILGLFTVERPDWSVEEAGVTLGLASSTAYRYFQSLNRSGLLTSFGVGRYVLGPTIIRYDWQLRLTDPMISACRFEMDRIAKMASGEIVAFLCRLYDDQVMCVHQASVNDPHFALGYERGRPMPLFRGSASKVILANIPARHLRALYRNHATNFADAGLGLDWSEVRANVRKLRSDGYCITNEEVDRGMRGISVPLPSIGNGILGSLSIAGPRKYLSQAKTKLLLSELQSSVRRVEKAQLFEARRVIAA